MARKSVGRRYCASNTWFPSPSPRTTPQALTRDLAGGSSLGGQPCPWIRSRPGRAPTAAHTLGLERAREWSVGAPVLGEAGSGGGGGARRRRRAGLRSAIRTAAGERNWGRRGWQAAEMFPPEPASPGCPLEGARPPHQALQEGSGMGGFC